MIDREFILTAITNTILTIAIIVGWFAIGFDNDACNVLFAMFAITFSLVEFAMITMMLSIKGE